MRVGSLARLLVAHPILGLGIGLIIRSELGAAPWDVFHVGLARAAGLSVGTATSATAVSAVLVALTASVRPGLGTLINAILVGLCVDAALALVPAAPLLPLAAAYLIAGIVLFGLGTGLYLSADLGSGPRDSLMVALARRRSWSVGRARLAVELTALLVGLVLGGRAGVGTMIYAVTVGPVAQWGITLFGEPIA